MGGETNPLPVFLHPLLYYSIVKLALSRRTSALEPRFFIIIIVYAFRRGRNRSSTTLDQNLYRNNGRIG